MKLRSLILLLFSTQFSFGQFTDDFSDGDLNSNPQWAGELVNFETAADIVDLDSSLHLSAPVVTDTSFLITNESVGKLDKISLVRDLEVIYDQDSIVKDTMKLALGFGARSINIFEKSGSHLLTLTPNTDSIPKVQNVRVNDPRFITEKGIGLNSTFKDIKEKYSIKKIIIRA